MAETENNIAVWALKRQANEQKAKEDYCKLNEMFNRLNHQNGFFINLNSEHHYLDNITHECENLYNNNFQTFRERIAAFTVQRSSLENIRVIMAYWQNNELIENVF